MSNDKEKLQRETDKDEWEEETNILNADTSDLEDNTVEQRNPFEAVREAKHLASVALFVSVAAVVISVVSVAISLSL